MEDRRQTRQPCEMSTEDKLEHGDVRKKERWRGRESGKREERGEREGENEREK